MPGRVFLPGFRWRDPASRGTSLRSQDLLVVSGYLQSSCTLDLPDSLSLPAVLFKISFHLAIANLFVFLYLLAAASY